MLGKQRRSTAHYKLWKSTNGGRNWTQVVSVNKAQTLTFGAGFDVYPAVYIFGQLSTSSKDHFYRSDDAGQSWIRINEHSEKEVWSSIRAIAGDRNIPGRLYATASGQGVVFGGVANDEIETLDNTDPTNENAPVVQTEPVDQSNTVSDSESESMEETEPAAAIELVINTEPANKNAPVVEIEPADESNLIDANVSVNEATLPDEMEQGTVVGTKGGGSLGWSLLSLLALLTARLFRIHRLCTGIIKCSDQTSRRMCRSC